MTKDSLELIEPDGIELVDTVLSHSRDGLFNINCNGGDEGLIQPVFSGGSGQYFFNWTTENGSGLLPDQQDQSGLTAGTYHDSIWDESGCAKTWDFTLSEPDSIQIMDTLSLSLDHNYNINCFNGNEIGRASCRERV